MITIRSTQRKIKIDVKKVKAMVQGMLDIAGYENFDLGIWLTTNKTIRAYNKRYRKKEKPTDILSFPFQKKLNHENLYPDEKNLGDIIISLEYAKKAAEAEGRSLIEHVRILLAHGIAHLLGYDHQTDEDFVVMREKEKELLR